MQIENSRQPVFAERPLEMVCRAYGARPAAQLTWWRGASELRASQGTVQIRESVSDDTNVTTSALTFMPQLDDAGRLITCKAATTAASLASDSSGNNDDVAAQQPPNVIEDSWKLDVYHLPRVRLQLGDKLAGKRIIEGHDVYFECNVRAHPHAHEIRWWLDGRELDASNSSAGVIISNQSLVMQRVQRSQRGKYTCSAINSVGEAHSNPIQLRIEFAPVCAPHSQLAHKTHYGAARNEPTRVYCRVDADPVDSLQYRWAFVPAADVAADMANTQQNLVNLDAAAVQSLAAQGQPLVSVATYTTRADSDYGALLCWARNELGEQAQPCVYHVVAAEQPEPVRNCRLLNATDTQLSVACEPGYDGGIAQSFHMEVYELMGEHTQQQLAASKQQPALVANVSSNHVVPAPVSMSQQYDNTREREPVPELSETGAADAPEASAQQLLVSSPSSLRLQKQRHSLSSSPSSTPIVATTNNKSHAANALALSLEAVLVTGPQLHPATNYELSIYASNSRGPSKPVTFVATTTNLANSGNNNEDAESMEPLGTVALSSREGRRLQAGE